VPITFRIRAAIAENTASDWNRFQLTSSSIWTKLISKEAQQAGSNKEHLPTDDKDEEEQIN
jgi:hypothetical protein